MAHNLFGDRFVSVRSPAWHKLGMVLDEPLSALKAWELAGPYEVQLENLIAAQSRTPTTQKAIVRLPCKDDPQYRVLGTVSEIYTLITPTQFCEVWDRCTDARIETIGALGNGETFFVSTKLPSFSIKDDELDNYLLGISPMTGQQAAQVRVTPVRVVCQNTLIAAQRNSSETHRVVHTQDAVGQLAYWFKEVWEDRQAKTEALQEAFLALSNTHVVDETVNTLLLATYPDPHRPNVVGIPKHLAEKRFDKWEQLLRSVQLDRTRVQSLYEGGGTGSTTKAANGTAWGFYNAVVEYEDYGRKASTPANSLFGSGAKAKERAFQEALAIYQSLK
jgi:phage/plasmid-like protein (TIGR03299 family)